MSFTAKSRHRSEIHNERDVFFSFEQEDYGFKYVPETRFKDIIKNVHRQRQQEDEERVWASFVKEQELNGFGFRTKDTHPSMRSVKELLKESLQDVDRELKRLEEDALPERTKRAHDLQSGNNDKGVLSVNGHCTSEKPTIRNANDISNDSLVPILEEENTSSYKISRKDDKKISKTNARKSSSDPSIIRKKSYTRRLLYATNHGRNNSSSGMSTSRNSDNEDIYIRLDPLTIRRILTMQVKITELLNEISVRLCKVPLPDGDNDLKRRQQRAMEFAIRFSRNYLYDLNRFVISIQRHISAVSLNMGAKHHHRSVAFHQESIEQKLIAAHQLLLQALSAYCKHIPGSILKNHPDKLKDVLQVTMDLKDICDKLQMSGNYFGSGDNDILPLNKDLKSKCDTILSNLQVGMNLENPNMNCNNTESVRKVPSVRIHKKKNVARKNLSNRLSMYSADNKITKTDREKRTSGSRQKETKCNAKNATNIYGKYMDLPYPSPVSHTSSSKNIHTDPTKQQIYSKEEDIKTMMDTIPVDTENDSNLGGRSKCNGSKDKFRIHDTKGLERQKKNREVKSGIDNEELVQKVTAITKEHLSTLVPVIADLMSLVSKNNELEAKPSDVSVDVLTELLKKHRSSKTLDANRVSRCYSPAPDANGDSVSFKSKGFCESQKYAKNMHLICVSPKENLSDMSRCESVYAANNESLVNVVDERSADTGITLIIPEDVEQRFLDYRREYQKYCLLKPMYSSNTQNKPWDIVAWIADKLVEELLTEVAKELQMTDVIQKLFELEFQEF